MKDPPITFKEGVAPQTRLELAKQVESEYEMARVLLKAKKYKEALKKFKWVLANSSGSRKIFLRRSEILQLSRNYRPAKIMLKRWRDDKEQLVISQKSDLEIVREWDSLNTYLAEKGRTTEVFLKLAAAGAKKEILHDILNQIWQKLARARKYDLLSDYLSTLGFHLLLHSIEYDSALLFPTHRGMSKIESRREAERSVKYMLETAPLCYEVALGLGEKHIAAEFAKKILAVKTSDLVFASLIKGALRARAYDEAKNTFNEARKIFSIRQLRHSSAAINKLPKREQLSGVCN